MKMAPKPRIRPKIVAKSKILLSAGVASAFTGYRPPQSQYQAYVTGRPLGRSVNSPLEVDDLLLNLEHPVAHHEPVPRRQCHDRIGRLFYLFYQVAIDHHGMAVEPSKCNHANLPDWSM